MSSEQGWNLLVRSRKTGETIRAQRTKSRERRDRWMAVYEDLGEHGYQEVWDFGGSASPVWQDEAGEAECSCDQWRAYNVTAADARELYDEHTQRVAGPEAQIARESQA